MAHITNRTEMVNALLADIRKHKILSAEEERNMFIAYNESNDINEKNRIRETILNANLAWVFSVANEMAQGTDKVLDYFNELCIAYTRAFDNYNVEKGWKFISFVAEYFRNEKVGIYSNESSVRRTYAKLLGNKPNQIRNEFFKANGREATDDEVADILAEKHKIVVDVRYIAKGGITSLNDSASNDEDSDESGEVGTMAMALSCENEYEREIEEDANKALVARLMSCLTIKEKMILEKSLNGLDKDDIAEDMGLTNERVRQILKGCEKKMKTMARNMGYKVAE